MIKRIIFDLDGTLIKIPNFESSFKKLIDKHNLNIDPTILYKTVGLYDRSGKYEKYEKNELLKFVNEKLNLNLDLDFLDDFFDMYNKLIVPVSDKDKETLNYLYKKYDLVVLTNWFNASQIERLKYAGIYKYFSNVYGGDIVPLKPRIESYKSAMQGLKPSECVMIGDSIDLDIKVPIKMGMKAIYITEEDNKDYVTIKKLEDLKEML